MTDEQSDRPKLPPGMDLGDLRDHMAIDRDDRRNMTPAEAWALWERRSGLTRAQYEAMERAVGQVNRALHAENAELRERLEAGKAECDDIIDADEHAAQTGMSVAASADSYGQSKAAKRIRRALTGGDQRSAGEVDDGE